MIVLNSHPTLDFTSFHILWPQKLDHKSLFSFSASYKYETCCSIITTWNKMITN